MKILVDEGMLKELYGAAMQVAEWADDEDLGMAETILDRHDGSSQTYMAKIIAFVKQRADSTAIQSLIAEYEMKLENAERYGHGDELIYEDMIKNLKELVG